MGSGEEKKVGNNNYGKVKIIYKIPVSIPFSAIYFRLTKSWKFKKI